MLALPPDAEDALILHTGWLDQQQREQPTTLAPGTDLMVASYGQSFTNRALWEARRIDGHFTWRTLGGPAAPPSHSYSEYVADSPKRKADVVVFGILASAVPKMFSTSGLSWTFEHPAPFTFPRYRLQDGALVAEPPVVSDEASFRRAFAARGAVWRQLKAQLRADDRGFDPLAFDRTPLDCSEIVALMRRGWVASHQDYDAGVRDAQRGFDPNSEEIRVLNAMLVDVASRARQRHEHLIVLLLQDRGYGNQLDRVLGKTLRDAHVDYISTHTLFSSSDPLSFQSDGHFSNAANRLLAVELEQLVRAPRQVL